LYPYPVFAQMRIFLELKSRCPVGHEHCGVPLVRF
jgi:hypothetical protein